MIVRGLLLAALLLISGCAVATDYGKAKLTAHRIDIDGHTTCSATAVGPNALLTATHCLEGAKELLVSGNRVEWSIIADDGLDHLLVRVSAKFDHWALRGPEPQQGDRVFMWGNPWTYRDLLRTGYYVGEVEGVSAYDMEGGRGDSGAAIFNKHGQIVGVLGAMQVIHWYRSALSSKMKFTQADWDKAAE